MDRFQVSGALFCAIFALMHATAEAVLFGGLDAFFQRFSANTDTDNERDWPQEVDYVPLPYENGESVPDTITDNPERHKISSAVPNQCTIIFDFDGVIKVGEMAYATEVGMVTSTLKNMGLRTGIATMSCEEKFIRGYLRDTIDGELFHDGFLDSEAAQFCEPKKSIEMSKIIQFHGGDPRCAILFDDSIGNKGDVEEAGHVYYHLDKYVGITMDQFFDGINKLKELGCAC